MKEIYAITLEDDVPLSTNIASDIREIAFLLFDELNKFDRHILCIEDDHLIVNDLYESYIYDKDKYTYKLLSDKSKTDYRMYEPFIISNNVFAITVYKDSIDEEEISYYIRKILNSLNLDYNFSVTTEEYIGNKINDRLAAIELLTNRLARKKTKKLVKTRVNPILSVLGL